MVKKRGFPKIFFGWWMILTSGLLNLWGYGFYIPGFSVMLKPLAAELGLTRAATSIPGTIGRIGGGLEAPVSGWLSDKFGPKRVILLGIGMFSLGLILMYFVNSLWAFCLVWGAMAGIGLNFGGTLPLDKVVTNWFVKKRGLAQSVKWVFSAWLLLPLVTWLNTTQGWRTTCLIGGLVMLCVGLPLVWFFIRDQRPEYYGLLPDGATVEAGVKEDTARVIDRGVKYAAEVEEVEFTLRQAMRTPAYWLLAVVQFGWGAAIGAMGMHLVPCLTDMGMEPIKAATSITIATLSSVVTRFAAGFLGDRAEKESLRFLYGASLLLQAGGIALFMLHQTLFMVYPFLLLYYFGYGANLVLSAIVGGRYFGRKAYGTIRGSSQMFIMPASLLAPIWAGWMYDISGNYVTPFTTFAALFALSGVVMFFTRPPKSPSVITDIGQIL